MRSMVKPASARARALARHAVAATVFSLGLGAAAAPAPIDSALASTLRQQAEDRARAAWGPQPLERVEVTLGQLDPRLQLAACARIEPFVPPGSPPWGATRIGLRCAQGAVGWKVTLPATVQMIVRALVVPSGLSAGQTIATGQLVLAEVDAAARADPVLTDPAQAVGRVLARALVVPSGLSAGQTIATGQLVLAEVDAAARADPVLTDPAQAVGRVLARALAAGEALRRSHLRTRQWFAAGEMVRIVASGAGWTVSGEGRAIGPGVEGQPVSARTEAGQTVTGYATGDHRLELPL